MRVDRGILSRIFEKLDFNQLRYAVFRPRREKSPLDDSTNDSIDDHEEEFYYTEVELGAASSPPTLSHRDMARPPHEGKKDMQVRWRADRKLSL